MANHSRWWASVAVLATASLVPGSAQGPSPGARASAPPPFIVYDDAASMTNRFRASGYMGDIGDIRMDDTSAVMPHGGSQSIQVVYSAKGQAPHSCDYRPPCRWAGVYWQQPANNWGRNAADKGRGYTLSAYNRLTFWARSEAAATIEFGVGGIDGPYGDSMRPGRRLQAKLTGAWQQFAIDLTDANLTHIIGGFYWSASSDNHPRGIVFYLDDIRFERK